MSEPRSTDLFKSFDTGLLSGRPAFLFVKQTDTDGDAIYLRHYSGDGECHDVLAGKSPEGSHVPAARFVKDDGNTILALAWFHSIGQDRHQGHFSQVVTEASGIKVTPAQALDFPNVIEPILVNLVPSGENIYFACIDGYGDGPGVVCLATFDAGTLQPTSRVTRLDAPLSDGYGDAIERQLGRNMSLVTDFAGGAFLQFVTTNNNIAVYRIEPPEQGNVKYHLLFRIEETDVGYHNAVYDKEYNLLLTVYSDLSRNQDEVAVYGVASRIFGANAPARKRLAAYPAAKKRLNLLPGGYTRPVISLIPHSENYLVSWEGKQSINFAEFSAELDHAGAEQSVPADMPGNHRSIAAEHGYGIGYQDRCDEPRFVGLEYLSTLRAGQGEHHGRH
jgi:hypothetical protein